MKKLIIAGTRDLIPSVELMKQLLEFFQLNDVTEIVSGGATGVDTQAIELAKHLDIPYTVFPAEWEKHGNVAGPMRNKEMASYSDALLLIWNGKSPGSKNMKDQISRANKPLYEVTLNKK